MCWRHNVPCCLALSFAKRCGYGPIGNGGNGLIWHSALAVNPERRTTNGAFMAEALEPRT